MNPHSFHYALRWEFLSTEIEHQANDSAHVPRSHCDGSQWVMSRLKCSNFLHKRRLLALDKSRPVSLLIGSHQVTAVNEKKPTITKIKMRWENPLPRIVWESRTNSRRAFSAPDGKVKLYSYEFGNTCNLLTENKKQPARAGVCMECVLMLLIMAVYTLVTMAEAFPCYKPIQTRGMINHLAQHSANLHTNGAAFHFASDRYYSVVSERL